ncbi:MAG: hypothetical protein J6W14_05310 [Clostridia bacterium]|nr:hypothetical protein [Clostridia bacterium]
MKLTRTCILCLLSLVLVAVTLLGEHGRDAEEMAIPTSVTETTAETTV